MLLVDVSGSMAPQDRLPLLKDAFRAFVDQLRDEDQVAIVIYAGAAGTALAPTPGRARSKILAAIDALGAGGSTAGGAGPAAAPMRWRSSNFDRNAVNRVILVTDGDFNVGISRSAPAREVHRRQAQDRRLSVGLRLRPRQLNDVMMQTLAQAGNGTAAYIDTLQEARKVLSDELASTTVPDRRRREDPDRVQPGAVAEYRLIGYETRLLQREDFNNDRSTPARSAAATR